MSFEFKQSEKRRFKKKLSVRKPSCQGNWRGVEEFISGLCSFLIFKLSLLRVRLRFQSNLHYGRKIYDYTVNFLCSHPHPHPPPPPGTGYVLKNNSNYYDNCECLTLHWSFKVWFMKVYQRVGSLHGIAWNLRFLFLCTIAFSRWKTVMTTLVFCLLSNIMTLVFTTIVNCSNVIPEWLNYLLCWKLTVLWAQTWYVALRVPKIGKLLI